VKYDPKLQAQTRAKHAITEQAKNEEKLNQSSHKSICDEPCTAFQMNLEKKRTKFNSLRSRRQKRKNQSRKMSKTTKSQERKNNIQQIHSICCKKKEKDKRPTNMSKSHLFLMRSERRFMQESFLSRFFGNLKSEISDRKRKFGSDPKIRI